MKLEEQAQRKRMKAMTLQEFNQIEHQLRPFDENRPINQFAGGGGQNDLEAGEDTDDQIEEQ